MPGDASSTFLDKGIWRNFDTGFFENQVSHCLSQTPGNTFMQMNDRVAAYVQMKLIQVYGLAQVPSHEGGLLTIANFSQ